MKYEVQKQIEEIDKALGVITMFQIPNMEIPQEEIYEALSKAESCMKLMIRTLIKKDITMKELNEKLRNEDLSNEDIDFDN